MVVKEAVPGIYKITSPSGRVYIGQTVNFARRAFSYRYLSSSRKQPFLHASFLKHGFDSHEIKLIHELPIDVEREVLNRYEVLYWELYKCAGVATMNACEPGRGSLFPESLAKVSAANKGKVLSESHAKKFAGWNRLPIIQLSKHGEFIKEWPSAKEAARHIGGHAGNIRMACRGKHKYAYEYSWKYKEGPPPDNNGQMGHLNGIKWYVFTSPNGEIVNVFGLSPFCRTNNLSIGAMWMLSKGQISNHQGWRSEASLNLPLKLRRKKYKCMDARSLSNLQTLHPKFMQQAIDAWTKAQAAMPPNVQIIVICGIRTFAESDALYAQGRTAPGPIVTDAPAGESYHNYGLAFDFSMVTGGKDDDVVGPHWMEVVSIMKAAGMTWGGDFQDNFKDYPHFENKMGYNWRDLLAKHNAGDFIPGTTFVDI